MSHFNRMPPIVHTTVAALQTARPFSSSSIPLPPRIGSRIDSSIHRWIVITQWSPHSKDPKLPSAAYDIVLDPLQTIIVCMGKLMTKTVGPSKENSYVISNTIDFCDLREETKESRSDTMKKDDLYIPIVISTNDPAHKNQDHLLSLIDKVVIVHCSFTFSKHDAEHQMFLESKFDHCRVIADEKFLPTEIKNHRLFMQLSLLHINSNMSIPQTDNVKMIAPVIETDRAGTHVRKPGPRLSIPRHIVAYFNALAKEKHEEIKCGSADEFNLFVLTLAAGDKRIESKIVLTVLQNAIIDTLHRCIADIPKVVGTRDVPIEQIYNKLYCNYSRSGRSGHSGRSERRDSHVSASLHVLDDAGDYLILPRSIFLFVIKKCIKAKMILRGAFKDTYTVV